MGEGEGWGDAGGKAMVMGRAIYGRRHTFPILACSCLAQAPSLACFLPPYLPRLHPRFQISTFCIDFYQFRPSFFQTLNPTQSLPMWKPLHLGE